MPLKRYKEFRRLSNGHSRGITAVSFSPAGTFVATGGLDGRVCIWRLVDGKLLHTYSGQNAILSLKWLPLREDAVLCGSQDGNIIVLTITAHAIVVRGFWAHKFPVECLAIDDSYVASGAHREVAIWQWSDKYCRFYRKKDLPEPPTSSHDQHREVLVTSLHWTMASATTLSMLMVSYMYHSIHLFETKTWGRVRTIPLNLQIGSASLSDNGEYIAISNMVSGFDVYAMATEAPYCSFEHDLGEPYPTPVLFVHGGKAIVGGSAVGKVDLWDLRLTRKMHTLSIPSMCATSSNLRGISCGIQSAVKF
ncbi:WD40-repeat-containing domain protein [Ganoderma leucocontextum]|nr:WD40-repeat-containing domain protein [Ganoderma leucocontextum]